MTLFSPGGIFSFVESFFQLFGPDCVFATNFGLTRVAAKGASVPWKQFLKDGPEKTEALGNVERDRMTNHNLPAFEETVHGISDWARQLRGHPWKPSFRALVPTVENRGVQLVFEIVNRSGALKHAADLVLSLAPQHFERFVYECKMVQGVEVTRKQLLKMAKIQPQNGGPK